MRRRLLYLVGSPGLTSEQAIREQKRELRRILGQAFSEQLSDLIRIKCNGCGRETNIARDVKFYNCQCSPQVDRFVSQSRRLDLPVGSSAVEHLLKANTGRESSTIILGR